MVPAPASVAVFVPQLAVADGSRTTAAAPADVCAQALSPTPPLPACVIVPQVIDCSESARARFTPRRGGGDVITAIPRSAGVTGGVGVADAPRARGEVRLASGASMDTVRPCRGERMEPVESTRTRAGRPNRGVPRGRTRRPRPPPPCRVGAASRTTPGLRSQDSWSVVWALAVGTERGTDRALSGDPTRRRLEHRCKPVALSSTGAAAGDDTAPLGARVPALGAMLAERVRPQAAPPAVEHETPFAPEEHDLCDISQVNPGEGAPRSPRSSADLLEELSVRPLPLSRPTLADEAPGVCWRPSMLFGGQHTWPNYWESSPALRRRQQRNGYTRNDQSTQW